MFIDQAGKSPSWRMNSVSRRIYISRQAVASRKYLGDCDLFRFTPETSARETVARVTVTPGAGSSDATLDTVWNCSNENGRESRSSKELLELKLQVAMKNFKVNVSDEQIAI